MSPVSVSLSPQIVSLCERKASSACIGGLSAVRGDRTERKSALSEDQLVGMLGQAAVSKHFFGSVEPFMQARWVADRYPTTGDGGTDIIGTNIDVKTSLMRRSKDPMTYHLWVREREFHKETVYVLALLDCIPENDNATVHLVGWITGSEIEARGKKTGDRHEVQATELHPVMPLMWWK